MITNIERTLNEMQRAAETRGIEKGQAKGKIEGKLEAARAALREGLNVDIIRKITGLSMETILELKNGLKN